MREEPLLKEFMDNVRELQEQNASGVLKEATGYDDDTRPFAKEYMRALRGEQYRILDESRDIKQLNEGAIEINKIEEEIGQVKRNRKFKL